MKFMNLLFFKSSLRLLKIVNTFYVFFLPFFFQDLKKYVFISLIFVNGMKRKFNFKLFHYYWLIHLFLIDLKCHISSYLKFFYFCSKNLFIYSCANITLYLFKWPYNTRWRLVGRNSPLCSFFFQSCLGYSWTFTLPSEY